MATKYQHRDSSSTYNRRAYTEAQPNEDAEYDDPNALPVEDDCDEINFNNYKGIYANDDAG
jgi:hypothetical protein